MSFVDLLIRNQLILFALVGCLAALSWFVARKFLTNLLLHDRDSTRRRVRYGPSSADSLDVHRLYLLFIVMASVVAAITAIGLFEPIPKAVALPLPELSRDVPTNKKLLVFLHGWDGDPNQTWQRFPQLVLDDREYASFNVLTISYPTFYVRRNLGVKPMARWINDRFERDGVYGRYDGIWIIAHSMGGLIARELLIANRLSRENMAFRLLIEIATPHQGASVAALAQVLGVSRGFVEDVQPGSSFLSNLREDWNSLSDRPRTFCLASPHDLIVSDASATAQCDKYLRYPQWGHIEMVKPSNQKDERYSVPMSRLGS